MKHLCKGFLGILLVFIFSVNVSAENKVEIPKKYDLRELDKTSPVKNQGGIGSCWSVSFLD